MALKLTRGHIRKHALEAMLCLVGIALGVAVVVGIDLAVAACVSSFSGAVNTLADRATHSITHMRGYLTDEEYVGLLRLDFPGKLAPVIDRRVVAAKAGDAGEGHLVHLFGIDPFAERELRGTARVSRDSLAEAAFNRFVTQPAQVVIVAPLAETLGAKVDDQVTLTVDTTHRDVTVCGVVPLEGAARAQLPDLLIADLATAQELTGSIGKIDRVDTVLSTPEQIKAAEAMLPAGMVLRATSDRANSLKELTAAYTLNLTALSMMASFVAVFIVYNALLVSVQQRSTSLAILRCLGSSRWQLASLYLVEALAFAVVGAALGILGGFGIAQILVGYISTTINDLYAAVRPAPVMLDWVTIGKGVAISLGSGLVGAAIPLYQASRTAPINVLRSTDRAEGAKRSAWVTFALGLVLLLLGVGLFYLPTASPVIGFAMALTTAFGFALLCPLIARAVCAALAAVGRMSQSLPMQMAAAGVSRSLGITGVAVAAMMLALAMSVGIQTMVSSFRGALALWLDQRFRFDVLIAPALTIDYKIEAAMDPAIVLWVKAQPEAKRLLTYRFRDIVVQGHPTQLLASQTATLLETQSLLMKQALAEPFDPQRDVLVSEPLAGKLHLHPGESLTLDTPTGPLSLKIQAIYYDFGSDRGQLTLDSAVYRRAFADETITSIHVKLSDRGSADGVAQRWQRELGGKYPIVFNSVTTVKTEVIKIFNRTFAVTEILAWLAGIVAFCGLAGALLALSLARAREYAVLTSLGMSRAQTAFWLLAEGLVIALTAAAVASVAGTVLSFILANVIQYRSFGWSIPSSPKPIYWLQVMALATGAAVLACVYPLHVLKRSAPAMALRSE